MSFYPIKNNIATTLRNAHSASDGVLQVATGTGSLFGVIFPIRVTCQRQSDRAVTIFQVSDISGDNLSVTVIEDTTDYDFKSGDVCEMRLTAGAITALQDAVSYTTESATTTTVGGIPAGSTFTDMPLNEVIDQLLHAYQSPTFSSFTISGATNQEVGQIFSGSKTFTWSTSNSSNIVTNSLSIADVTANITLGTSLANDGSETFSVNVTHNSQVTHVWWITARNTNGISFSMTTPVSWLWRLYYGTSASVTLNEAGIEGLTSNLLTSTFIATYSYGTGGYKYLCFPDSLGGPSVFKDASTQIGVAMCDSSDDASYSHTQNGFSYALISVTNTNGVTTNYRVYRTKNILGGSINIIVN